MYAGIVNDELVEMFETAKEAREFAEHVVMDNLLNNLGIKSVGFLTPDFIYHEIT